MNSIAWIDRVAKSIRLIALGALISTALVSVRGAPATVAATITVDTPTDELNADGDCSLREAIRAANTDTKVDNCPAGSGADTIFVPAGTYTVTLRGNDSDTGLVDDFDLFTDMTINGAGAATTIIDGNQIDRVFDINHASVTLTNLTIQKGSKGAGGSGGGIFVGDGSLTLSLSTVRNNKADTGGGIHIFQSTVTVDRSTISDNRANTGAGISNGNGSSLSIDNSTIKDSEATVRGGGIANLGSLTIDRSSITNNMVTTNPVDNSAEGGGIYNKATARITRSTVNGNKARTGAGIQNVGELTLINSTVSGNSARGSGGGISNIDTGALTLNNVTIANNIANSDNSPTGDGGGISATGGTVAVSNSILARNTDNDNQAPDCTGTLNSQGYNLIENLDGCTITGDTTGNITGADPKLDPLMDVGGPTFMHALQPGSPAIDAGNPASPESASTTCASTDQRNVARPQDGDDDSVARCDIGSYERRAPNAPTDTPTPSATPTSTVTPSPTGTQTATPTATAGAPITPTPPRNPEPSATPDVAARSAYIPLVAHPLPTVVPTPTPPRPATPCNDRENNDLPKDAKPLTTVGQACIGSLEDDPQGEDDYYSIRLNAGQTVRIDLAGIPGGADYDLQLLDARGGPIAQSALIGESDEQIIAQAAGTGTYYIRINLKKKAATARNTYILQVTIA